jgi:hypothetical protein
VVLQLEVLVLPSVAVEVALRPEVLVEAVVEHFLQ